jgi:hypothetical protein
VTRIVCNELAEHILARLGVRPPGGISANAAWFQRLAGPASAPGTTPAAGPASASDPTAGPARTEPAAAAVQQLAPELVTGEPAAATSTTARPGTGMEAGAAEAGSRPASAPVLPSGDGVEVVADPAPAVPAGSDARAGQAAPDPQPSTIDAQGHLTPTTESTPGPGGTSAPAPASAPFFKQGPQVTAADLVPGAQVFFIDREWTVNPQPHDVVHLTPGAVYHVPPAQANGPPGPAIPPGGCEHDGWTYRVEQDRISRSRTTPLPPAASGGREPGTGTGGRQAGEEPTAQRPRVEVMRWSHQATIVGPAGEGSRVLTIETTGRGAGLNARTLQDLQRPYVFVGWAPAGSRPSSR